MQMSSWKPIICIQYEGSNSYSTGYTNPKKLLYKFPHPNLLRYPIRTFWDGYYQRHCYKNGKNLIDFGFF